jgi:hypothetical protein
MITRGALLLDFTLIFFIYFLLLFSLSCCRTERGVCGRRKVRTCWKSLSSLSVSGLLRGNRVIASVGCFPPPDAAMRLCAYSVLCGALFLVAVNLCAAVPSANFLICYQLPYNGTDVGFSYNTYEAIKRAEQKLRALYPTNLSMSTRVYMNQASVRNMTAQMIRMIEGDGCRAIMSASRVLYATLRDGKINDMSAMYPNIRFWIFNAFLALSQRPPNVYASTADVWTAYFVAGAAAAVTCSSCVALLLPFANYLSAGTAMSRGMQFGQQFRTDAANVSQLCPLHVFYHGSFNNVLSEVAFTRMMHQRGCSIIAMYSDTCEGARLIQREQLKTPSGQSIFSITGSVNGAYFIGDTVLTSLFIDMGGIFFRFAQSYFSEQDFISGKAEDGVKFGELSPLADPKVAVAVGAAFEALGSNGSNVWCPPLYNQMGVLVNPIVNGSIQCVPFSSYFSFEFVEHGIVQYPMFRSPTNCPGGTFASYSVLTDLSLTCVPCPEGTHSPAPGALSSCLPCPGETVPDRNRTACRPLDHTAASADADVLLVALLATLLPCTLVAGALLVYIVLRRQNPAGDVLPPAGPEVAIAILDVDPANSSSNWREEILLGGYIFEVLRHSVITAAAKHQVYIVSSVPRTFILAAATVRQVVEVAEDVERTLVMHNDSYSSTYISIRAVVTFGLAERARNSFRALKVSFVGPAVDKLVVMFQDPAVRSGLCLPVDLFEKLKEEDETLSARMLRTFLVQRPPPPPDSDNTAPDLDSQVVRIKQQQQQLHAVSIRFRYIAAPGTREQQQVSVSSPLDPKVIHAMPLSPGPPKKRSVQEESAVLRRGQTKALHDMFVSIASRFLFTASLSIQRSVANCLAARFRIFLPIEAGNPSSPSRLRDDGLQQMISYVTPLALDALDQMNLREQIQTITSESLRSIKRSRKKMRDHEENE